MTKYKVNTLILTFALGTLFHSQTSMAQASINEMQSCQAVIDFIKIKIDGSKGKYSTNDVKVAQKGLDAYNNYIQTDIIDPGLLSFYKTRDKANEAQKQIDTYKQSLVQKYQQRFPEDSLYMDSLSALNNCTMKAVPSGNALEELKASFEKMIEFTKVK